MKFVVQRVNYDKVTVDQQITGEIQKGFLVFIGVSNEDTKEIAKIMRNKNRLLAIMLTVLIGILGSTIAIRSIAIFKYFDQNSSYSALFVFLRTTQLSFFNTFIAFPPATPV